MFRVRLRTLLRAAWDWWFFWGRARSSPDRGPDRWEDQSLRQRGAVWCILAQWLVTQTENPGRTGLVAMVISRTEQRAGKKIEPFRRFQYSDRSEDYSECKEIR